MGHEEEQVSSYRNGGILSPGMACGRNTHPWKTEFIVPLKPTPEQVAHVAAVMAFQSQIDLIDTSWLDEI
ncbi:hypothetical protein [Streptomyces scabiei]|uniref:hypothetical protein n=1 Tax=Streptomyces scabiei TaxID=1930 RepID=UPI00131D08CE|nr:hypothetical protein [Streptomyces scabiei]